MRSGASPLLESRRRPLEWQVLNMKKTKEVRKQSLQYLNLGGRTNMRFVRHMHSVGMLALVAGMPLTYTVRD